MAHKGGISAKGWFYSRSFHSIPHNDEVSEEEDHSLEHAMIEESEQARNRCDRAREEDSDDQD